ncbi:methyltransferase domain-containing protein [Leptobacterium flavescens]|uniref:Methyltransferase domain-containing protein n=1 Tax=Leptobacterium flavescens TaxID=472055 RepID=A0A6P0UUX9_9FLAO|nr:class I SAM-dependent methyltransferase [Leptobacterium flavescens]NER14216.1 methyltransferase domain-containing protein [Leptobacterium flavescens]
MTASKNTADPFLICKDHTVSGEEFQLLYDTEYDMLITHPQPSIDKLPSYYKSEDYISHTDSSRNLFEYIYQKVKSYALRKKLGLINSLQPEGGNLLDLGAGTGDFLHTAKKGGWNILGTEPDADARKLALEKGVELHLSSELFPGKHFHIISMWHVLEHVSDLQKQTRELKRLLHPEGTLLIAVPNYKSLDAKIYGAHWAAYDVPRHLWHFSQSSISALMKQEDLMVEKVLPMKFDSYYVSLLSEKYKSGKMNFLKAFINGFRSNRSAKRSGEYSSLIYVIKNS